MIDENNNVIITENTNADNPRNKNPKNKKKIIIIISVILLVIICTAGFIIRNVYINKSLEKADMLISQSDYKAADSLLNNLYNLKKSNNQTHLMFYKLSLAREDSPLDTIEILNRAYKKTNNNYYKKIADDYRENGLMSDLENDTPSGHYSEQMAPIISAEDSDYGEYYLNDAGAVSFEKAEQVLIKEKRNNLYVNIYKNGLKKSFEYEYIIGDNLLDAPEFAVKDGAIKITNIKQGEAVYYTLDGTYPNDSSKSFNSEHNTFEPGEYAYLNFKAYKKSDNNCSKTVEFIYKNPDYKDDNHKNMLNLGLAGTYNEASYFLALDKYPKIESLNNKDSLVDICEATFINPDMTYIYYSIKNEGIYRVKNNGGMRKTLTRTPVSMMSLYAGKIFFINANDNKLYRMDTDGGNLVKITDISITSFSFKNNDVYITSDDDYTLYKFDINSSDITRNKCEAYANSADAVIADENELYYVGSDGNNIYSVDYASKQSKLKIQAPIMTYAPYKDHFVYVAAGAVYVDGKLAKAGNYITTYMAGGKLYATYFKDGQKMLKSDQIEF